MKTVLVLSILTALTAAAPSPDNHFRPQVHSFPVSSLRQKKSNLPENVVPVAGEAALADFTTVVPKERTLKKKLIFKKSPGHLKLFQDSSEEKAQADSKEHCTKEVKIKFCGNKDVNQTGKINRTTIDILPKPISDSEVKQNIQLAKEVVENIQKMAQKLRKIDPNDAELHEDIEIAKQALNHIQQNFDKLESLSLRVATFTEAGATDVQKNQEIPKTEVEGTIQRKRVQKSVDVPKDIEDSFKSSDNLHSTVKDITSPKNLDSARLVILPGSEKVANFETLRSKSNIIQEKSDSSGDLSAIKMAAKETEVPTLMKASENSETMVNSPSEIIVWDVPIDKFIQPWHLPTNTASKNTIDMKESAAEGLLETHRNTKIEETIVHPTAVDDLMPFIKSKDDKTFKELIASPKIIKEGIKKMIKATKEEELNLNNNQITIKSVDQQKHQPIKMEPEPLVPKDKNVEKIAIQRFEASKPRNQQKNSSPIMKTATPEPHHGFHGAGISESFHTQSHHHGVSSNHLDHHHLAPLHHGHSIFKGADMDGAQSMQMNVQEASEKPALEEKRNPNQKAALEKNMLQWNHNHNHAGSARGAYGAGAYAGSGATSAVFPGSRNSPCAVPLLLSCSPNVVHGALTSHSYGTPAYRSEGSNLHHKRDTTKPTGSPQQKRSELLQNYTQE